MTTEQNPAPQNSPDSGAQPAGGPAAGTEQQTAGQGGVGGEGQGGEKPAGDAGAPDAAAVQAAADRVAQDKAAAEKAADESRKQAAKAQMDQAVASWKDAVKADPTLGGEKLEATIVDVDAGLRAFATQDFTALMEATGLRHHPETVKTFAKLGAMLREGKVLTGTAAKQPEKSLAELLYPTSA